MASGRDPTHMALTYKNIRAFIFHDAVRTLRDGANGKGRVIVPPKRSSFRLLAVIICCAAALWLSAACGDGAFKDPSTLCETNSSAEEGTVTTTPENPDDRRARIHEVRLKYDPLFWRQPNVVSVGEGLLEDENRDATKTTGIVVGVSERTDQSTLPAEDRIPDCLEGVPVQIIIDGPVKLLLELLEDADAEGANDRN